MGREIRWTVSIETWGNGVGSIDSETLMMLTPMLTEFGAEGVASSAGGIGGGPGATFGLSARPVEELEAMTVGEVTREGVRIFDEACGKLGIVHGGVARVDVMQERYGELDLAREPEAYLGVSELAAQIGVSRQRVSELRTRADFPAPIVELAAGPVWAASSLRRFLDTWERKPGRPSKARATGAQRKG